MQYDIIRTYSKSIKDPHAASAFRALALAVKNLQNCTVFVIRQILSSYENKIIKNNLHEEQLKVLNIANECVTVVNNTQAPKLEKKRLALKEEIKKAIELGIEPPKQKEFKSLGYFKKTPSTLTLESSRPYAGIANPWQILNISLLDKIMQGYLDDKSKKPYRALPATIAQQAVNQVRSNFMAWLSALDAYEKDPSLFTGIPKMPGYAEKNALAQVKFTYGNIYSELASIEGKDLFEDFDKTLTLSQEARQAYSNFDVAAVIEDAICRSREPRARPKEIRIIPKKTGVVVEVVLGWAVEIEETSPLGQALSIQAKSPASKKLSLSTIGKRLLTKLKLSEIPNSAGADLGLNNILTLAFTNGAKSKVISNGRFEHRVKVFDEKIDTLLARLASPRQRELQQKWDLAIEAQKVFGPVQPHQHISIADLQELKSLQTTVHQNKELLSLRKLREQWVCNALHKISANVVDLLLKEDIKVLVVGKNVGWKNKTDLGSPTNRRRMGTAHSVLIEKLTYKCMENGILVVETEESYTSKTSFAKNEPLKAYAPKEEKENKSKKVVGGFNSHGKIAGDRDEARPRLGVRCTVKESNSSAKHAYVTKSLTGRWSRIHADVNAAFNILRKVYTKFFRHNKLSSSFELLGLTHRGLDVLYIRT